MSGGNWLVWAEYSDVMAKLCRYDEAVAAYRKAMPLRPKPRFWDCEESIFHICMIHGDMKGTLETQQQMLQVNLENWTTEGETVDAIKWEIRHLEGMIESR